MVKHLYTTMVIVTVLAFCGVAGAKDKFDGYDDTPQTTSSAPLESWYCNLGLDFTDVSYPSYLNDKIDAMEELPGHDRTRLGIDVGIYFPVSQRMLLGGAISGSADSNDSDEENTSLDINQYLLGVSGQYYIGRQVGHGFFLRSDVGAAWTALSADEEEAEDSETGVGFLVGAGYSLPVTSGSRIALQAAHTVRRIDGETYQNTTIGLRILF